MSVKEKSKIKDAVKPAVIVVRPRTHTLFIMEQPTLLLRWRAWRKIFGGGRL